MRRAIYQPFSGLINVILTRPISNIGNDGILGSSSFTLNFINSVYDDLNKHKQTGCVGIGRISEKYGNAAELSHIDSPEDDDAFHKKLDNEIHNLFSRIPLPSDPMKAALAPTEDELNEKAEAELIKEAVREAYLHKMAAKKAEELRLKWAAEQLDKSKSAEEYFRHRTEDADHTLEPSTTHPQTIVDATDTYSDDRELEDELTIQRSINDMKERIKVLEGRLNNRKRS
ncbi:unnamed protein product [Phytomonas sp. EM1]|nr:unnamed protein product [Phytomonas sp. EM1]|eukprot:CCW60181.1 unnamed protein product [Phytomonas sp. isolate EM1]